MTPGGTTTAGEETWSRVSMLEGSYEGQRWVDRDEPRQAVRSGGWGT